MWHRFSAGESSFDIYGLAYECALPRRDRYELAGTFGLHCTDLSLALSARASASGGTLAGDVRRQGSVGAPLPVIGLRGLWSLPDDLWLDVTAQYSVLSIDEHDGNLQGAQTDAELAAEQVARSWHRVQPVRRGPGRRLDRLPGFAGLARISRI